MDRKDETSEILSQIMKRTVENYNRLKKVEQWNCRNKSYFVHQIQQLFHLKKKNVQCLSLGKKKIGLGLKSIHLIPILHCCNSRPLLQEIFCVSTSHTSCVIDVVCSINSLGQKKQRKRKHISREKQQTVGQIKISYHKSSCSLSSGIIAKPTNLFP